MAVKDKRRRRLILLLLIVSLVLGASGGLYAFRKHQIRSEAMASRHEGIAAFESGEYFNAMHKLGTYLHKFPKDVEASYKYARARLEVKERGGASFF